MIGFLALASVATVSQALAWAPTQSQQQALVGGEPVSEVAPADDGAGLIHAAIDIPAPPKTVWEVMRDCNLANRLITSLTSCKVLQNDSAHGWDVRETVTRGNFFVPSIHNVVRSDYQPYSLIRFKKAGGNLKIEEGEWRLEPLNGGAGTRVIYVNLVAADLALPAGLVREGMRKDTAKVMVNLRRESIAAAH
jgi:uncharacterized protein YndB with AHSA1/START domain